MKQILRDVLPDNDDAARGSRRFPGSVGYWNFASGDRSRYFLLRLNTSLSVHTRLS